MTTCFSREDGFALSWSSAENEGKDTFTHLAVLGQFFTAVCLLSMISIFGKVCVPSFHSFHVRQLFSFASHWLVLGNDALLQMFRFTAAVELVEMLADVAMVILADPIRLVLTLLLDTYTEN